MLTITVTIALIGMLYRRSQDASEAPISNEAVQNPHKVSVVDLAGLPVEGDETARVAVIDYSDYECEYCIRHARTTGDALKKRFILTGKVRHAFVNYPLRNDFFGRLPAKAALCALEQRRYWEMHDELFKSQPHSEADLVPLLQTLHLDEPMFNKCFDGSDQPIAQIDRDIEQASDIGIMGTPTFAIGRIDSTRHKVYVTKLIVGAQPLRVFESVINALSE